MIFISEYSGKADLFDHFGDATDEELQHANIYIGDNIVPLRINNQHDLAPYYPYIISMGGWSKGYAEIHLSSESFIDEEEREHLTWKLEDVKRYWRSCKRKKIPYDIEKATQLISFFGTPNGVEQEIAERVAKSGDKATIDGLHDYMHEYYRKKLLEEMVRLGWDKRHAKFWIWKDWKMLVEEEDNSGTN